MSLQGKCAVVTGGGRGLGRAVCLELARNGVNIMLCYAGSEAAAKETAAACKEFGTDALAVKCDVSDAEQVSAMTEAAMAAFRRIDILVNNAGITRDGLLMSMT